MPLEFIFRVTKDYLRDILKGVKILLKINKINFCTIPAYDEIGVKALYPKVIKLPGMSKFFPNSLPKGKQCCKQYMYNIWNTIYPEDVKEVLANANRKRFAVDN